MSCWSVCWSRSSPRIVSRRSLPNCIRRVPVPVVPSHLTSSVRHSSLSVHTTCILLRHSLVTRCYSPFHTHLCTTQIRIKIFYSLLSIWECSSKYPEREIFHNGVAVDALPARLVVVVCPASNVVIHEKSANRTFPPPPLTFDLHFS